MRELALWLRPPGWPALPEAVRPRVRALATFAIVAQLVFVASWLVGGALEPGYSHTQMYISELGRAGAAHPWIFDAGDVVFGAGIIALGLALAPGLRSRPWWWAAPALFVAAGVLVVLVAPLQLDCAPSVDRVCRAREAAGALSWHHYGHGWATFVASVLLLLTPFALARAEWPSRLARGTLAGGTIAVLLYLVPLIAGRSEANVGTGQRLSLLVVHCWVTACAVTLVVEASPGWPPRTAGLPADAQPV